MTQVAVPFATKLAMRRDTSGGPDACWPWTGRLDKDGYANVRDYARGLNKRFRAHRLVYEDEVGPIPDGMWVLHRCDNPPCCNPAHLFLGDHDANMRDRKSKGRYALVARGASHPHAKLDSDKVAEMRRRHAEGESQRSLARAFGVTEETGRKAILGVTWAHVPLRTPRKEQKR